MTTTSSLYERIGGHDALVVVVEDFYDKVLDDPALTPWFDGVDMGGQKTAFAAFVKWALGGEEDALWHGRSLRQAHAGLVARGLSDAQFDAVVGHLAATMAEHGVSMDIINEVGAWAETVRDEVLNR